MVLDLKLQSTVEPIQPLRAVDVHRRRKLQPEPVVLIRRVDRLIFRERLHTEVRECDLDVQNARHAVADDHVREQLGPRLGVGCEGAKPQPVHGDG